MTDHANDIAGLLILLQDPPHSRYSTALRRLVAERDALRDRVDALRKRIAELESQPPASDLRERLLESALRGANVRWSGLHRSEAELIGKASVWMVDAAIDAMRKGEA